jgi:hypothetical protein
VLAGHRSKAPERSGSMKGSYRDVSQPPYGGSAPKGPFGGAPAGTPEPHLHEENERTNDSFRIIEKGV